MIGNMKDIIAEKYLDLTTKQDIDKITVKALAATCNISRQAFYYHYSDIFEVIEWLVKKEIYDTFNNQIEINDTKLIIQELIEVFINKNSFIYKVRNSSYALTFDTMLVNVLKDFTEAIYSVEFPDIKLSFLDKKALTDFVAHRCMGFLLENCKNNNLDIKRATNQLYDLIFQKMIK